MIVQWFVEALAGMFSLVLDLLPSWSAPGFLTALPGQIADIGAYTSGMAAWLPWTAIGTAVPILLAAVAVALAVKGTRMVLSLFTGGGGSAA